MAIFAVENGYAEAIIRGFRASFFTDNQYTQIKNCSSLDELKSVMPFSHSSSRILTTDPTC
jgi:V-type H+-transporting ATPase subunit d